MRNRVQPSGQVTLLISNRFYVPLGPPDPTASKFTDGRVFCRYIW